MHFTEGESPKICLGGWLAVGVLELRCFPYILLDAPSWNPEAICGEVLIFIHTHFLGELDLAGIVIKFAEKDVAADGGCFVFHGHEPIPEYDLQGEAVAVDT